MQDRKHYTYVKKASGQDLSKIVRAVAFPVAVFFLSIFGITIFQNFGRLLMAPCIGFMWITGAVVAWYMPAQRKSIINETLTFIASYNGTLLGLRELVGMTSGISAEMLMATFGQPLSVATANTIPGWLQNALYASAAMIPLGFLGMEGKRMISFVRSENKKRALEQLRNIRYPD